MDHEWGRNLYIYGLTGVGASVCSPRVPFPDLILTNAPHPSGGYRVYNMSFPAAGLPYYYTAYYYLDGHPHFPGGRDAVPDAPV